MLFALVLIKINIVMTSMMCIMFVLTITEPLVGFGAGGQPLQRLAADALQLRGEGPNV